MESMPTTINIPAENHSAVAGLFGRKAARNERASSAPRSAREPSETLSRDTKARTTNKNAAALRKKATDSVVTFA